MYYVPNILIRRSRAPSDVFTVTVASDSAFTFDLRPKFAAGIAGPLYCDWGDGGALAQWGTAESDVNQSHSYSAGNYTCQLWGPVFGLTVGYTGRKNCIKGCNYNWGAVPGLGTGVQMFNGCAYLVSPLTSLPEVGYFTSMFQGCTRLPIAFGFVLPTFAANCGNMFYNCGATNYDINDLGSSFPVMTNIAGMFQGSYFYGDATAFKNKCAANVTYTNAFLGSRCTNIPA